MTCAECRSRLYPYLDSELEVADNLGILEHLNACAACREAFEGEERMWRRVRDTLRRDTAPAALAAAVPEWLERESRRLFWRRAAFAAIPIAAAVLVFAFVAHGPDVLRNDPPPHGHTLADHGAGIDFAVSRFLELEGDAERSGRKILDPEILKARSADHVDLEGAELQAFYQQLFGPDCKLPPEITQPRVSAAALQVGFRGTPVSNMILDMQDRRIGIYKLARTEAALMDLHVVEDGVTSGIRIERCRKCFAIAVTRGDWVYILVSKEGVEPLIQLARQTF
jgi:hypothetical protein